MRRFFRKLFRLCLLGLLLAGFWYYENCTIQTEVLPVVSAELPAAFDGFRIAVITDLHGRSFGEENSRLLDAVREAGPDIIALDGDIVDENSDLSMLAPLCRGLSDIAPVFYVTGNHEWRIEQLSQVLDTIANCGVTVLANDYRVLTLGESQIVLAGVHDPNGPYDMRTPEELTAQIRAAYPDNYLMVLNHRNDALDHWAALGADLVISGHGHGGVIRIPGVGGLIGTDRSLFPDYTAGLYTKDGCTLAVSRGFGFAGIPLRLFNRPELMVLELKAGDRQ